MGDVIRGVSYDLTNRTIPADGTLVALAEHYMDPMILDWQMKHPSVMRDRIPMGKMELFNGLDQKSFIFRGTLGPQAGLTDWLKIEPSRKPSGTDEGLDSCSYNPQTYTWAFDAVTFDGLKTSWRSPVFCVNELKFQDRAEQQLGMILKAGFQNTDMIKETYAREQYLYTAAKAGKMIMLTEGGGLDYIDNTTNRVTYNPLTATSISYSASCLDKLSSLNFSQLDLIHQYLSDQCPDAALSYEGGMPVYGLMIDLRDFEKFVLEDDELREDFRRAIPQRLIEGFNMSFKVYRGWAIMHDPRQPRWTNATTTSTVVTATRVLPRRATRAGVIGSIPESNPAYVTAGLGAATVFMKNVVQILVPSVVSSLGSGMVFGPAPDFNGAWSWLNIQDAKDNPLKENGYFFSRYEYFCKQLEYAQDVHVMIYRRCMQSKKTGCAVEADDDAADSTTLASAPAAGDFSADNCTVVLSLNKKLTAGAGDKVTVKKDDTNTFTAYIAADDAAPKYTLFWVSGATNAPTAVTEINDTAVVTVTVG